jgi:hypothetical protein
MVTDSQRKIDSVDLLTRFFWGGRRRGCSTLLAKRQRLLYLATGPNSDAFLSSHVEPNFTTTFNLILTLLFFKKSLTTDSKKTVVIALHYCHYRRRLLS